MAFVGPVGKSDRDESVERWADGWANAVREVMEPALGVSYSCSYLESGPRGLCIACPCVSPSHPLTLQMATRVRDKPKRTYGSAANTSRKLQSAITDI